MQIVLLKCAEADLRDAYASLEERRSGLGDLFLRALNSDLGRLRERPRMEPVYKGIYRRLVLRTFGYGVFYTLHKVEKVMVLAILDLRQPPDRITSQLLR